MWLHLCHFLVALVTYSQSRFGNNFNDLPHFVRHVNKLHLVPQIVTALNMTHANEMNTYIGRKARALLDQIIYITDTKVITNKFFNIVITFLKDNHIHFVANNKTKCKKFFICKFFTFLILIQNIFFMNIGSLIFRY